MTRVVSALSSRDPRGHADDSEVHGIIPTMTGSLRQPEPSAREGVGWRVFEHLAKLDLSDSGAVERMTREQRMVFGLNMLRQEVNSDGFDAYFRYQGGNTAAHAAEGARIVSPRWSALIDEACRAMGSPYPSDVDSREGVVERVEAQQPELFPSLDDRFYQLEEDEPADERIDGFIWTKKSAFFI
jgi:hypothetical protein